MSEASDEVKEGKGYKLAMASHLEAIAERFPLAKIDPNELVDRCCKEDIDSQDKEKCQKAAV